MNFHLQRLDGPLTSWAITNWAFHKCCSMIQQLVSSSLRNYVDLAWLTCDWSNLHMHAWISINHKYNLKNVVCFIFVTLCTVVVADNSRSLFIIKICWPYLKTFYFLFGYYLPTTFHSAVDHIWKFRLFMPSLYHGLIEQHALHVQRQTCFCKLKSISISISKLPNHRSGKKFSFDLSSAVEVEFEFQQLQHLSADNESETIVAGYHLRTKRKKRLTISKTEVSSGNMPLFALVKRSHKLSKPKTKLRSQHFQLATLLLITTTHNSDGYGYQQTAPQQSNRPHPIYGSPPLSSPITVPCSEHTSASTAAQVPVLTAVVRTLEPSVRKYEVKLSQTNQLNLLHRQPPQHTAINGPFPYYTNNHPGNHQPVSTRVRYLPPTIRSQPRPYQQAFRGGAVQYGNSVAGSHISYTPHQNPLLTSQYLQRTPPTSLTPPAPLSQSFSNNANQQQQQSVGGSQLGHFQQSNSVGLSGNAPNSQFSSAAQSSSASAAEGSINGVPGNYIAQSEVGQLDHYFEKQNPVGDIRAYTRLITTCYADGHCEQQQLGTGQADQRHQHTVLTARARIQPITDKCRNLGNTGAMAAISVGSVSVGNPSQNSIKRPPNRRLYPYTEVVIPRDPFNWKLQ